MAGPKRSQAEEQPSSQTKKTDWQIKDNLPEHLLVNKQEISLLRDCVADSLRDIIWAADEDS